MRRLLPFAATLLAIAFVSPLRAETLITLTAQTPFVDLPVNAGELDVVAHSDRDCQTITVDAYLILYNTNMVAVRQDDDGAHNWQTDCVASRLTYTIPEPGWTLRVTSCCGRPYGQLRIEYLTGTPHTTTTMTTTQPETTTTVATTTTEPATTTTSTTYEPTTTVAETTTTTSTTLAPEPTTTQPEPTTTTDAPPTTPQTTIPETTVPPVVAPVIETTTTTQPAKQTTSTTHAPEATDASTTTSTEVPSTPQPPQTQSPATETTTPETNLPTVRTNIRREVLAPGVTPQQAQTVIATTIVGVLLAPAPATRSNRAKTRS